MNSFVEVMMYIMYTTVAVTAIGGNGIVCYLVLAYQKMRTVTNYFIVNLAIGDILMASLCIPFGFVSNLLLQYWPFGSVMCIIVSYSQAVSVFISAYTLIAISIDRYIAIIYPLRPRMTKLQAKLIIFCVWIVAILTPLPTAVLSRLMVPEGWIQDNITDKYICTEEWDDYDQRYYYSMALMILQYVFPLTVLIFTYAKIAWNVWGKTPPGEAEDSRDRRMAQSKRRMVKMMITCVTAFTLCWLPFNVLVVIGDQFPEIYNFQYINYVWFACHFLSMSHACYNPFIYVWMNSRFRSGFRYVLYKMIPFVKEPQVLPDFLPHVNAVGAGVAAGPGTIISRGTMRNNTLTAHNTSVTSRPISLNTLSEPKKHYRNTSSSGHSSPTSSDANHLLIVNKTSNNQDNGTNNNPGNNQQKDNSSSDSSQDHQDHQSSGSPKSEPKVNTTSV